MSIKRLKRELAGLLGNLLVPGFCLACGTALAGPRLICRSCARHLERVPQPCQLCGLPSPTGSAICAPCLMQPPRWQGLIAPFAYRGLTRDYLHAFKYDEALYYARCLCDQAWPAFRPAGESPEVLLPVPLHRSRLLERGFNQARIVADLLGSKLDIPVDVEVLSRVRHTPSQSDLSAAQRVQNVRGAFSYDSKREYRHVALVDDIVTTGSTVDAICRELHRGGVENVEVWALARAYKN